MPRLGAGVSLLSCEEDKPYGSGKKQKKEGKRTTPTNSLQWMQTLEMVPPSTPELKDRAAVQPIRDALRLNFPVLKLSWTQLFSDLDTEHIDLI